MLRERARHKGDKNQRVAQTGNKRQTRSPSSAPPLQEGPNPAEWRLLRRLARSLGVQLTYIDAAGQRQEASPETLRAMIELWGFPTATRDDLRSALNSVVRGRWQTPSEPVLVAWNGRLPGIPLRLPERFSRAQIRCRLRLESGLETEWSVRPERLRLLDSVEIDGVRHVSRTIPFPSRRLLPPGYHTLEIECPGGPFESLILSAPEKSYFDPENRRLWGIFLPTYAAHSTSSWGAGDWRDWRQLSCWVNDLGGDVMGTLPLLAGFLQDPCEPSPYSPASRLFWNEFYLNLEELPEFSGCAEARRWFDSPRVRRRLEAFRQVELVDYRSEMELKREGLEILSRFFFSRESSRRRSFRAFVARNPKVEDYARFRAALEQSGASWWDWPDRMRNGRLRKGDYAETACAYHLYAQWAAEEQVFRLSQECRDRSVRFYLDLPLGVHPNSYDVWRERESFALDARAGAPPDPFFCGGQNWGFPPLHPEGMRNTRHRYLLDFLRFQMRQTGLLRIDHVMGLHRLYWIPKGFPASQGAYVTYPAEELHAILNLESHRNRTILVGENLGTVPPEVNASMKRHGLRQMFVLQYELRPNPERALRIPSRESVASLNTHDMPTFAAFWKGLDILDREDLGILPSDQVGKARQERRKLNSALVEFLQSRGFLKTRTRDPRAVLKACLAFLARSPAEIVLLNLEDLWLEEHPQNVPSTSTERPNWRRKSRYTLEEIEALAPVREILEMVDRLRRQSMSGKDSRELVI